MPHALNETRDASALLPASPTGPARPRRRPRARANAAIAAAVCRHLLHQLTADQPPLLRYYLELRGSDPETVVLHRLRALMPGVQPRSQCRVSVRTGVTDRATGAAGALLEVTSVSWRRATAVQVVAGYYATPWRAAAFRYRVDYQGGQWVVTAARGLWRVSPVR
jgi:hypothetical protein